jgi:hypothetical protein
LKSITKKTESDTADFDDQIAELSDQLSNTRQAPDDETRASELVKKQSSDLLSQNQPGQTTRNSP